MTNFDTPSHTQMADFFDDMALPEVSDAETQHPYAGVLERGPEGSQSPHEDALVGPQATPAVDPTEHELRPDQLLLIVM